MLFNLLICHLIKKTEILDNLNKIKANLIKYIIKLEKNCLNFNFLFVITVILIFFARYKHEISMVNYAKPNQTIDVVRYSREFAITVIVITEFDCISVRISLTNYKNEY